MEKDKIFFGEVGLTSTSANYCANISKELYRNAEAALNSMVLYNTTVKLIGSEDAERLRTGWNSTDVNNVSDTLKMISELKSLIAWLREAIKAKERLIKSAQSSTYEDYGLTVPECPEKEVAITADDYIATLSIKERNRYFYLEACCATIGEYIHPGGVFANEREQLSKVLNEPNKVSGSGRDTLLYTMVPSVSQEDVDKVFMGLQQTYREYQAEFNSIKHQIEDAVNRDVAAKNIEYSEKLNQYTATRKVLDAQLAVLRKQAVDEACNLKIVIPDSLKPIFEKVQRIGKDTK